MVRIDNVVAYSNTSVGFLLGEDRSWSVRSCVEWIGGCRRRWEPSRGPRVRDRGQRSLRCAGSHRGAGPADRRSSIKSNNTLQNPSGGGIGLFSAQRATIRDNDFGFNSYYDIYISGGNDNVIIRNVLDCMSAIFDSGVNTYAIVNNSPYPDTNRTHRGAC